MDFFEDEKQRELVLRYAPGTSEPVDGAALAAAASAAGYGDIALDKSALEAAAKRIAAGESFSVVIGRRLDTEYQVAVAPDQMSATLTVIAAHGGKAADLGGAGEALGGAGVVFGVDAAALANALAAPGTTVVIAHGTPARDGTEGRLEKLINVGQAQRPKEDEKGRADFRELGILHSVDAGTPLLRRHPARPGQPGRNVLGVDIAAAQTKDVKLPHQLVGVEPAPRDPNLLIASIAGHPVFKRDRISIDPILVLPEVSLATGNIDFIGAVEIKGDVQSGMKIKAGGDVVIHGTLESAEVEAEGSVEVKGGVIGQRAAAGGDTAKPSGVRIHAKGDVRAHHIENATVFAERSVFVDELIVQSDVTAMEEIVVGKEGARKGHIIGGSVRATRAVTAICLGASGSSKMNILVGVNPPLLAAFEAKKAAVAAKRKEQDDLEKVIKVLQARAGKADMLAKAQLTLDKINGELAALLAELEALDEELKLTDKAEVVVKSIVHPGVCVTIGRKFIIVADNLGAGTFRLAIDGSGGREEEVVAFQR